MMIIVVKSLIILIILVSYSFTELTNSDFKMSLYFTLGKIEIVTSSPFYVNIIE